jgi:hypothetical protein
VLTELLFLWGHRLGAVPEEHGRYGKVLGSPFHDGPPHQARGGASPTRPREPSELVGLVEASTLPHAVALVL